MRKQDGKRSERLRLVVDTLPYETRVAMLEGLRRYEIIAGAYSDRNGGVCPMLAAHRCGGRTDLRSFARAWDRFTGARRRARRASARELRTLAAHLERSLWREDDARRACTTVPAPAEWQPEPGEAPKETYGAWLIPFRDWDQYRAALGAALEQMDGTPAPKPSAGRRSQAPISA